MLVCKCCGRVRPNKQRNCKHCGKHALVIEPSLSEIKAACFAIQKTWSQAQERNRRAVPPPEYYELPAVSKVSDRMLRRETWGKE
jgi:hypothetical protein